MIKAGTIGADGVGREFHGLTLPGGITWGHIVGYERDGERVKFTLSCPTPWTSPIPVIAGRYVDDDIDLR